MMRGIIDQLVISPKLIVSVNTLPLYLISQMYIPTNYAEKVRVIKQIFSLILE